MPMTTAYPDVATETVEPDGQTQGNSTPVDGQQQQQDGQQQPVDGQQQQPADPNWDGKQWALKYRDQTIVPKDRNHLINLAQQGFSYSQRMHELNEREQKHKEAEQRYEQYQRLEKAFEANPKFRDQILTWYNQSFSPDVPQQPKPQGQQDSNGGNGHATVPPELLKEISDLKQWKTQWEEQQAQQQSVAADKEIGDEMTALKEKYKRDDWETMSVSGTTLMQDIIKHAMSMGGIKLETAYRDLMWDSHVKTTEAETLKKAAENQKAAKRAGVVSGGSGAAKAPAAELNTSGMNYDQITKELIKNMNLK